MSVPPTPNGPIFSTDAELVDLIRTVVSSRDVDLDQLHDCGVIARAATDLLRRQVTVCRDRGATWTDIGAVLGITRQAAQQRFSWRPSPEALHRRLERIS